MGRWSNLTSIFFRWVCSTTNQCLLIKEPSFADSIHDLWSPSRVIKPYQKSHKESPRRFTATTYFHAYYATFRTTDRFLMLSLCNAPCLAKAGWRICICQGKALKTSGGLILKRVWKTFRKWPQFGSVNPSSLTPKNRYIGWGLFPSSLHKLSQRFVSLPGGKMMPKEAPNGRREVICEDALKWLGFEKMNMLGVGQVLIFAAMVWSGKSYQYSSYIIYGCWGATPTQQQWSFEIITLHL